MIFYEGRLFNCPYEIPFDEDYRAYLAIGIRALLEKGGVTSLKIIEKVLYA